MLRKKCLSESQSNNRMGLKKFPIEFFDPLSYKRNSFVLFSVDEEEDGGL